MKKLGTLSSKTGKYTVTIGTEKLLTPIMIGMMDKYEYKHKTVKTWGIGILCFIIELTIYTKKEEEVLVSGFDLYKNKKGVKTIN